MEINVKTFKELTKEELYEILRCRAEVFVVGQDCVYLDPDGVDFHALHVFIREDGRICSYIRVIEPGAKFDCASIGRVLTLEQYRRKGYARALMKRGIELAKEMSDRIEIEAQAYLIEFYKSLGFEQISDLFMLEGMLHAKMMLK